MIRNIRSEITRLPERWVDVAKWWSSALRIAYLSAMAAKGRKKTSAATTSLAKSAKPTAKKPAPPKKAVAAKRQTTKKSSAKKSAPPGARKTIATKKTAAGRAPKKAATKKIAAKEKAPTRASAPPMTKRSPSSEVPIVGLTRVPIASPSERLLAACAEVPTERSLTDEEREAMAKVSETARRFVGAEGAPTAVVESIAAFLDEVRLGKREAPTSQDVRLGLGVLWGEQLRAQVGWRWVHLSYPDGFASYALVPDDRAFACFPLNRVPEALRKAGTNTSARVFESIRENALPARRANAYLVIG